MGRREEKRQCLGKVRRAVIQAMQAGSAEVAPRPITISLRGFLELVSLTDPCVALRGSDADTCSNVAVYFLTLEIRKSSRTKTRARVHASFLQLKSSHTLARSLYHITTPNSTTTWPAQESATHLYDCARSSNAPSESSPGGPAGTTRDSAGGVSSSQYWPLIVVTPH